MVAGLEGGSVGIRAKQEISILEAYALKAIDAKAQRISAPVLRTTREVWLVDDGLGSSGYRLKTRQFEPVTHNERRIPEQFPSEFVKLDAVSPVLEIRHAIRK